MNYLDIYGLIMNSHFIEIYTQSSLTKNLAENTIVKIFHNQNQVEEISFNSSNDNMLSIYASIFKNLGYKLTFTTSLELFSDVIDFHPDMKNFLFYQNDNFIEIPIHINFIRDFYEIPGEKNHFKFNDIPNTFIYKNTINNFYDFETLYLSILKNLTYVKFFNLHSFDEDFDISRDY